MEKSNKNKDLVLFQTKNGAVRLRGDFSHETIWATQKQIAEIFGVDRSVVTKHIRKIFKEGELEEKSNVQKMHIANSDKPVKFYNLDIILAVGYRVNSARAIEFRRWASSILKKYLIQGYTINKQLLRQKEKEAQKLLKDLQDLVKESQLIKASDVLELVQAFSSTWFNLESYDKQGFPKQGFSKRKVQVSAQELYEEIEVFKKELIRKGEATELFAQEKKPKSLEAILGNVFQSVFGKDVYPSIEEKAAHLLYFIVKNHPFNDGNKRVGAFSFVWFLQKAKLKALSKITPETLTALTLLIAESNPKDKDKMIGTTLLLLRK